MTGFRTRYPKIWYLKYHKLKEFEKQEVYEELFDLLSLSPLKQVVRPSWGFSSCTWRKGAPFPLKVNRCWKESEQTGLAESPPVHYPWLIPFCPITFFHGFHSSSNLEFKHSGLIISFSLHFLIKVPASHKNFIKYIYMLLSY